MNDVSKSSGCWTWIGLVCGLAMTGVLVWQVGARAQDRGEQAGDSKVKTVGIMQPRPESNALLKTTPASITQGHAIVVGAATSPEAQPLGGRPPACFSCHGMRGAGDSAGAFPRLANQPAFYLYKQLMDYASGTRPNDIMTPIAKQLTQQQMTDVAAYYAAQEGVPGFAAPAAVDPLALQRGGALSAVGSAEKGIQGCANCHGPQGQGLPPSFPYLAGQFAPYTELQLQLWKQGRRNNDPLNVMSDIASRMSQEDIRNVAAYFAAMTAPSVSPNQSASTSRDNAAPPSR